MDYLGRTFKGKVKWFDSKKGYGFIGCPDLSVDVFVHWSNVIAERYEAGYTFVSGLLVQFSIKETSKGLNAIHVEVIE